MPAQTPRFGVGSNQYVKRPRPTSPWPEGTLPPSPTGNDPHAEQREDFAIVFGDIDVSRIQKSEPADRALARFEHQLPELIWNAAALEGNTYTLPEVRTLLDGVTLSGKLLAEQQQILALRDAYLHLDTLVRTGEFALTKTVSDDLHRLLARHEAIDAGMFRGEGTVTGGGHVRLASGGVVAGADTGEGGSNLRERFTLLQQGLAEITDPRRRALVYFASATRQQFYFDGNKRTARLMMAGELMVHGFDAVSIPNARRLEFNTALDTLFSSDDATSLLGFLATCGIH